MTRSKVAVLRTKPETVIDDYRRLGELAGVLLDRLGPILQPKTNGVGGVHPVTPEQVQMLLNNESSNNTIPGPPDVSTELSDSESGE